MARKQKDFSRLHGHRVVSGPELRATFAEEQGPAHPGRFRRRLFHGVVLTLLLGLIIAGVVGAWAVMTGVVRFPESVSSKAAEQACPATTFDYLPNNKVTVRVYNATGRTGLAKSIADQLKARGYKVAKVDNGQTRYSGAAQVISGPAGQAAAFNIQRNVAGTDYYQDERSDASVDLVLAPGFKELLKPALVDQTPGKLSCPRETRRIADDAKWPVLPSAAP
ncbi:LytR C-terminal domain-containing protein [Arthrobacter cupressi]|uniref:LytR cell envelope-related transcriptional attenuator n=1 Tax=Arthrobacter cupressi TaxID=1045773 RepID=A0A1G8VV83_9MICC|nr:LytR C-terminal domain-containing protein [Arthrobacter cupressi]NYD78608.1 molybdopterin-guanine dinucleotide biosynthesis protein [Arthrobacter cupressi]SDJ69753.1 LytR cell envelope-related transcriptional attenuator [Arthrobacter cupressi]